MTLRALNPFAIKSGSITMNRSLVAFAVLAAVCSATWAADTKTPPAAPAKTASAAGNMKPGLWEITTVNETAGSNSKRTVAARACYSAADVANVGRIVPQQREFGMKCETHDAKQQGFDATWKVTCAGKDSSMIGSGKMSLGPDAFSGRADLELKSVSAKPVKVEQNVTGKWIGPCK
jgi:Protein of unknown function (DUF3617)